MMIRAAAHFVCLTNPINKLDDYRICQILQIYIFVCLTNPIKKLDD